MNENTYIKKKNHIEDTMRLILIYSYFISKKHQLIALNQTLFAKYLNLSRFTLNKHIKKLRELECITVVGKHRFYNKDLNRYSKWESYIYNVDFKKLNQCIFSITGEDILNNIVDYKSNYINILEFIKMDYEERYILSLTEQELQEHITKKEKKERKREKELSQLTKENKDYIDLLTEINIDLPDEFRMAYLHEGKKRLINCLCITKNPENPGQEDEVLRYDLLHKFFNTNEELEEFDTNASIYRLSYALGNKLTAMHTDDMYRKVFEECNFEGVSWSKEFRKYFKLILMPIYMKESSIAYACNEYKYKKNWTNLTEIIKKKFEVYKYLINTLHMKLFDILMKIKVAMHKVFNLEKFYRANIFIHESNLHIIMIKLFNSLGIKTLNVYDGFYFIKGTMNQEKYDIIYDTAINYLLYKQTHPDFDLNTVSVTV